MPLTVAYGRQMDAMRTELRDWLWDGEFQDTIGARVTDRSSGEMDAPFSVFKSPRDGSLAVVVANYSTEDRVGAGPRLTIHRDATRAAAPPLRN